VEKRGSEKEDEDEEDILDVGVDNELHEEAFWHILRDIFFSFSIRIRSL